MTDAKALDAARRVASGCEDPAIRDRVALEPALREMMGAFGPLPIDAMPAGMWDAVACAVMAERAERGASSPSD